MVIWRHRGVPPFQAHTWNFLRMVMLNRGDARGPVRPPRRGSRGRREFSVIHLGPDPLAWMLPCLARGFVLRHRGTRSTRGAHEVSRYIQEVLCSECGPSVARRWGEGHDDENRLASEHDGGASRHARHSQRISYVMLLFRTV